MYKLLLALSFFLLAACGTEAKNFCPKEGCRPEVERQKREQCLAPGNGSFHELTVKLNAAPPVNMAVEINGERRFDECTSAAQKAPFVSVQRASGNRLIVRVDHAGAFATLPNSMAIKVINQQNCETRVAPVTVFTADAIGLSFSKEAGVGSCPQRDVARVTIQQ